MKRRAFSVLTFLVFILILSSSAYAGSWRQVNSDGFGDPDMVDIATMTEYSSRLYVGTVSSNPLVGGGVWEYNGTSWTQGYANGFGNSNNSGIYSTALYKAKLYFGTWNGLTGAEVWERDAIQSTMKQVNANGFGSASNVAARATLVRVPVLPLEGGSSRNKMTL